VVQAISIRQAKRLARPKARPSTRGAGFAIGLTPPPPIETLIVYPPSMRDDYIKLALAKIQDPNILINVVSRRVKQLKRGNRPLVESLEKLTPEDIALREIIDEKISFESGEN
jgi:DNA-directed RNA polymerase subunit omega